MDAPQSLDRIKGVKIEFIDQSEHRYDTVGDWFFDEGGLLTIRVSKMSDSRYSFAVALHEFIEAVLCTQEGITPESVDEFDMGQGADYDEPGKHPSAPYHRQHIFATAAEQKFIQTLGVPWDVYDKAVGDKGEIK